MKSIRNSILLVAILALPFSSSVWAGVSVGDAAPAFTLKDQDGNPHSLSDFKGKFVVLEWTNAGCPFVAKFYKAGDMQKFQRKAADDGVVWLTINSNAPGSSGHFDQASAKAYVEKADLAPAGYLLDPTGKVGKAFGARTTPHVFVVGPDGTVIYQGAVDNARSTNPADTRTATNYVFKAIAETKAGKAVTTADTKPYGCGIKYARK